MTWQFKRYDIEATPHDPEYRYVHVPAGDGAHVSAEDAINREAVNADRIRLLEVQLKEARNAALEEAQKTVELVASRYAGRGAAHPHVQGMEDGTTECVKAISALRRQ